MPTQVTSHKSLLKLSHVTSDLYLCNESVKDSPSISGTVIVWLICCSAQATFRKFEGTLQVQTALGAILRDPKAKEMPCGVFGSFGWSGEAVDELEKRLKVSP